MHSRYYNPEWGRFINADILINTVSSQNGSNIYAYCLNNPVNMADDDGNDPTPTWARNILYGNASAADYAKALSVNPNAWAGSARSTVDRAISIAKASKPMVPKKKTSVSLGPVSYSNNQKSYEKVMYAEWSGPNLEEMTVATLELAVASMRKSWEHGGVGFNLMRGYAGIQLFNDGTGVSIEIFSFSAHLNVGDYSVEASIGVGAERAFGAGAKWGYGLIGGLTINSH
ncbi:hypothetical protein SDC9_151078 [bioreactor metagenome]|uniref:RHS repeat-associated core domain-containing protein n=1 Tax=bioreactor metagenome TaxID=1076179 RepID=A0A645ETL4_9ZZZZ